MRFNVSRQLLLLAAVGVALVVVVMARRGDTPAGSPATPSNPARANAPAPASAPPVADVKLELLKPTPSELEPSERNPFQFKPKAPPPAPPPAAGTGPGPGRIVVAPPPVAAPVPQGPPPPPPIALKYIGVLETAQGRVAVFRDTGGEIVNGKEGDIIDGRYRLLKIGVESADVAYVDGRGRQTIRLSGQ
ncbi:MAG TPA: hypothetical protein VN654_15220 [Vicinamibacterales bacterium]|jgi:hypothetical protein|nr:hypothetical protein [Vicinamibacterales bacterium]